MRWTVPRPTLSAFTIWRSDRRECSRGKSFHDVANGRDECTMVALSKPKRKFRVKIRAIIAH